MVKVGGKGKEKVYLVYLSIYLFFPKLCIPRHFKLYFNILYTYWFSWKQYYSILVTLKSIILESSTKDVKQSNWTENVVSDKFRIYSRTDFE